MTKTGAAKGNIGASFLKSFGILARAFLRQQCGWLARLMAATATALLFAVLFSAPAQAQTQVVNVATITPPINVANTNPLCVAASGVCFATDTDAVTASPPIITKAFSPGSILAGGTALLTITITNTHALTSATLSGVFTDAYPAGLVNFSSVASTSCAVGVPSVSTGLGTLTLPIGTVIPPSSLCTVTTVVTSTVSGTVTNSIPIGSLTTTVGANTNVGSATLSVAPAVNLGVAKLANVTTVGLGATITFSFVITNAGPSVLSGGSFVDTLPSQFGNAQNLRSVVSGGATTSNFNISGTTVQGSVTIPVGGTVTVTIQVTTNATGSFTNTLTVTPPTGTTNLGSTTSTTSGTVTTVVNLGVTKLSNTTTVALGATTTFSFVITNAGPSMLSSAQFVDTLPAQFGN
ncbi:MAG: hypothetical protein H7332_14375, partial [Bdellovibrionales bacterium]|nr:hypothetical protein [Ramlibacter sp.]